MSNNGKNNQQKKNVLISSKEIEEFKIMLQNLGNDINFINTNYQQLLECNLLIYN